MKKVIYDLGANNGDDISYYLLKADLVVAVEANPLLCKVIEDRYRDEIETGRLALENCVVTDTIGSPLVEFYVHKVNHVLSQFPPPAPDRASMFEKAILPAKAISDLIATHGHPYYVKVDIEHYDTDILRALFNSGVFPAFVSAESHSIEVFALLVARGGYNAFKLVDGYTVSKVYSNRRFESESDGTPVICSFPFHSAGPFGNDVDGDWMTADNFFHLLAIEGLGWRDIHATNVEVADPKAAVRALDGVARYVRRMVAGRARQVAGRLLRWCRMR